MCHATPYASRQKLNTDIGIIQLATANLTSWDTAQTAHDNARTQPQRSHPKTQPSSFVPGGPRMRFVRALDAYFALRISFRNRATPLRFPSHIGFGWDEGNLLLGAWLVFGWEWLGPATPRGVAGRRAFARDGLVGAGPSSMDGPACLGYAACASSLMSLASSSMRMWAVLLTRSAVA